MAREASYYQSQDDMVSCLLCPQACLLQEGQKGICGVRQVEEGKLVTLNYGLCGAISVDPIEKKPLYHFYPGWEILSLGTVGCSLHCSFCQNWTLSRGDPQKLREQLTPSGVISLLESRPLKQQLGAAYTYNEPFVWYEFVRDTSELLSENGYRNVLVTNGMVNREPLVELLPFIHGINIDVKAFRDDFYRRYCKGKGVKDIIRTVEISAASCHVELTYLVIPTLNDDPAEVEEFMDWVAALDREIPVHFSRYSPCYQLDLPATPLETMKEIYHMAREKLSYVYLGNVTDTDYSSTFCPTCDNLLLKRAGFGVRNTGLDHKKCNKCAAGIRIYGDICEEKI